jgi:mannitol-1-phosphate 5-dehydrogenase
MKTLMYGAGNIGRGFMGQLFFQNGYSTAFVDINEQVINTLNKDRQYPIKIVSNELQHEITIKNVCGINGTDMAAVAEEIAQCDIMCTAVGVNVLPKIIPNIAEGIKLRSKTGKELNIIICENKIDANEYIKQMVKDCLPCEYHDYIENKVGFIEASVGRMVPVVTDDMKEGNLLKVWVEPFCTLPVDKSAFKGQIPKLEGIVPEDNFDYYIQSKLFLHNMGHCITAYLGRLCGFTYIYEAIGDDGIKEIVKGAMYASAEALSAEHGKQYTIVKKYADDLINRFGNRYLGDTVQRVGRDLIRKLGENDRLIGALRLCEKHGINTLHIKLGISAALLFGEEYDVKGLIKAIGL